MQTARGGRCLIPAEKTMNWKQETIEAVWQHGRAMPEADPSVWRQDGCGAWMRRDQFGDSHSELAGRSRSLPAASRIRRKTCARFTGAIAST